VVALVGDNTNFDAAPALTVSDADALVKPAAVTVMVALPTVVGVKLEMALPPLGVIGEAGLNVPEIPLTVKAIGVVAELTVLPLAS
jgi:hypothetical protein